MQGMISKVQRFLVSEDGPTAVEYAVMLALILVACISIVTTLARHSKHPLLVKTSLSAANASGCSPGPGNRRPRSPGNCLVRVRGTTGEAAGGARRFTLSLFLVPACGSPAWAGPRPRWGRPPRFDKPPDATQVTDGQFGPENVPHHPARWAEVGNRDCSRSS